MSHHSLPDFTGNLYLDCTLLQLIKMKRTLLILSFFLLPAMVWAQDFEFGQFSVNDFSMTKYDKDTTAHAVVLKEFGKAYIASTEHIPLVFEYHARIKIFDSKAFDQGTIEIPIYKIDADAYEEVSEIQAVSYYKDENSQIQTVKLNPANVFHVKENRYWDVVKFTLPNLHPGSVIEYKYHLETPLKFTFRNWMFQSSIPKIYSEYEAHLPAVYNYNVVLRGPYQLSSNPAVIESECFSPGGGIKCDCSKISYIMKDVPAFIPEDYMTAPRNFMSGIYFELSDYTDLNNGVKMKVTKEWKDVDNDMKHDDSFGGQIKKASVMKDRIQGVIAGKTDPLDKAKAVFRFLQKNYKWDGFTGWGSDDGIKKAFDSHSGSVADINLSLIAALNAAGIATDAVLLSTREHGLVNKIFPSEADFNYVLARATIGDKSYLLDASDPLLPFGLLPTKCINDQGRVMSMDKPSYWIDLVPTAKESSTYSFDLTLQENGKMKGTMSIFSSGYDALEKRAAIKKFNSVNEYVDDYDIKLKKIKITKSDIQNLDSLEKPLAQIFDIEVDAFSDLNGARFAFNPFIVDMIDENPFKLRERSYPVDRGALYDDKFMMNLHLPNGYTMETMPQNVAITMPSGGGNFIVSYEKQDDGMTFSHAMKLTHTVYSVEEYPYLKEMYNKIIQAETADVVIKKK